MEHPVSHTATAAAPPPTAGRPSRLVAVITGRRSKWLVLVLWIGLLGFGGTLGSKIGSVQNNEAQTWLPAHAESTRAIDVADDHFSQRNTLDAVVVYARPGGLGAADLATAETVRTDLARRHIAAGPISPVAVSSDRRAALITVPLPTSKTNIHTLGDAVDALRDQATSHVPPGLEVHITGQAGNASDFIHAFSGVDGALLAATIGIVALLLLLTYRSPVLWLVPLLSVGLASQVASGTVYLLAKHAGLLVNGQSASILTVLVLGVGTDYALLLVARYREELHRHPDRHEAMAFALRRCLPAISASAGTVIIATLCLAFGSMNSTRGLGPVSAIGVAVAYLAMTTLLPALLVILGRWVFWPAIPRPAIPRPTVPGAAGAGAAVPGPRVDDTARRSAAGADSAAAEHRAWARVARRVGRSPRPIWIGAVLVLAALAVGSATVSTGQTQADQFTRTTDSVRGQRLLAAHFPAGSSAPADIYTHTATAARVTTVARAVPGVAAVRDAGTNDGWTHLVAVLADPPDTHAAQTTVQRLRGQLHAVPDSGTLVGGQSAIALDTSHAQTSEEKLLIPLILAVVLVILLLLLRAVVAPVVLLLSVVLSYGAAVGTATLLFHALGHPRIDRGLLLMGFLFLVALGVDYTIFLMTRAREETQRRGHRDGVLTALTVTGGVITSAGLVLAATFSVLAVLPIVSSLQQGTLVAVGVLLDTFIVRTLLVPALALDIGARMWWPARLGHAAAPRPADPAPATASPRR
jgi:RND superfamily putative drug exporter